MIPNFVLFLKELSEEGELINCGPLCQFGDHIGTWPPLILKTHLFCNLSDCETNADESVDKYTQVPSPKMCTFTRVFLRLDFDHYQTVDDKYVCVYRSTTGQTVFSFRRLVYLWRTVNHFVRGILNYQFSTPPLNFLVPYALQTNQICNCTSNFFRVVWSS